MHAAPRRGRRCGSTTTSSSTATAASSPSRTPPHRSRPMRASRAASSSSRTSPQRKAQEERLRLEADKLAWIGRIQDALAEDRFVLHAQPIVDLPPARSSSTSCCCGCASPSGEIVGPAAFLPIAEEYGLIGEIDRWVIGRGAEIAATGRPVADQPLRSVDRRSERPRPHRAMHRRVRAPSRRTSSSRSPRPPSSRTRTPRASSPSACTIGCRLALDDFGTGYGGFTYLKQLPVDCLKIDIEFVRDLATNPASRHVVEAVVALARGFDAPDGGRGRRGRRDARAAARARRRSRPGLPHRQTGSAGAQRSHRRRRHHRWMKDARPPNAGTGRRPSTRSRRWPISIRASPIASRPSPTLTKPPSSATRPSSATSGRRPTRPTSPSSVHFTHRQAELDHRQARGDARQEQIDQAQAGGDQRQDLLDHQQSDRERPRASAPLTAGELQAETLVRVAGRRKARRRTHVTELSRPCVAPRPPNCALKRSSEMRIQQSDSAHGLARTDWG